MEAIHLKQNQRPLPPTSKGSSGGLSRDNMSFILQSGLFLSSISKKDYI